jgi:hypothetical protein
MQARRVFPVLHIIEIAGCRAIPGSRVSGAEMRDIGYENIQRQVLKYQCARRVILLTVDDMKEGRV